MSNFKNATRILYGLTLVWLLARFFLLFVIRDISLFEAHTIAVNMVQTGEMKYLLNGQWNYNYQFPVYPTFVYFLYEIFGVTPKSAVIFNCLLHSASVIAGFHFFRIATERFNHPVFEKHIHTISLVAALALLFHPVINYYVLCMVHPFAMDLCLLMLALCTMMKHFSKPGLKSLLVYAICFGIAVLNRTSMVILMVPFILLMLNQHSWLTGIKKTGIVLAAGLLISLPWIYRNYTIYKTISVNSSFGQNLWLGIQEQTGGSAYMDNGQTYYYLLPEDEWKRIYELNPIEQSDYFCNKYRQLLHNDPGLVIKMFGIKMKNFWWFRQGIGTEYSPKMKQWMPVYQIVFGVVLILSLFCMIKFRKKIFYLIGFLLAFSIFQSLFYVETRHRIIIEPILIWMAIIILYEWITRKKMKA